MENMQDVGNVNVSNVIGGKDVRSFNDKESHRDFDHYGSFSDSLDDVLDSSDDDYSKDDRSLQNDDITMSSYPVKVTIGISEADEEVTDNTRCWKERLTDSSPRNSRKVTFANNAESLGPDTKVAPAPQFSARMVKKLQEQKIKNLPIPYRKSTNERTDTLPKSSTQRLNSRSPLKVTRMSPSPLSPTAKRSVTIAEAPRLMTQVLHGDRIYSTASRAASNEELPDVTAPIVRRDGNGLTIPKAPRLATTKLLGSRNYSSSLNEEDHQLSSPKFSQKMERYRQHATLTEMKNKFHQDFRHYSPPKGKFVPRKTVPAPFSFRTEERAKIWNLSSSRSQEPEPEENFQFKARPMPRFDRSDQILNPSSWKEKNFTVPEPFDFESSRLRRMRLTSKDDNEVGRFRFKTLPVPDFIYRPLDSLHEVNLTVPFPFHLKIDERLASRIRFNGTNKSNRMSHARVSYYIQKAISADSSIKKSEDKMTNSKVTSHRITPGTSTLHHPASEVKVQTSMHALQGGGKISKTQISRSSSSSRRGGLGQAGPSSSSKGIDKEIVGRFRGERTGTISAPRTYKNRSSNIRPQVPEEKKLFFTAKKMPNFSKPFVPLTSRGGTPIRKVRAQSSTPSKNRNREPLGNVNFQGLTETRSKSSTPRGKMHNSGSPAANNAERSKSTTSAQRSFKAKKMPDFSKPFVPMKSSTPPERTASELRLAVKSNPRSLKISAESPKSKTRTFNIAPMSPMSKVQNNRFFNNSTSPRNVQVPVSPTKTAHYRAHPSPTLSLKRPPSVTKASPSPRAFKARQMPDFSAPFTPKRSERKESPLVLREDSKTFTARPLPDFSRPFLPKKSQEPVNIRKKSITDGNILDVLHDKLRTYEEEKRIDSDGTSFEKDKNLANAVVHAVLQDFLRASQPGGASSRKVSIDPKNLELQNIVRDSMNLPSIDSKDMQNALIYGSLSLSSSGSNKMDDQTAPHAGDSTVSALSNDEPSIDVSIYDKTKNSKYSSQVSSASEEAVVDSFGSSMDVTLSDDLFLGASSEVVSIDDEASAGISLFSTEKLEDEPGNGSSKVSNVQLTKSTETGIESLADKDNAQQANLIEVDKTENRSTMDAVMNVNDGPIDTEIQARLCAKETNLLKDSEQAKALSSIENPTSDMGHHPHRFENLSSASAESGDPESGGQVHPLMRVMDRLNQTMAKLNEMGDLSNVSTDTNGVPAQITTGIVDAMKLENNLGTESPQGKPTQDSADVDEAGYSAIRQNSPQGTFGDDFGNKATTRFRGGWHRGNVQPSFADAPEETDKTRSAANISSLENLGALSAISEEASAAGGQPSRELNESSVADRINSIVESYDKENSLSVITEKEQQTRPPKPPVATRKQPTPKTSASSFSMYDAILNCCSPRATRNNSPKTRELNLLEDQEHEI